MWTSKLRGASCLPVFSHRGLQAGFTLPHLQMWICFRGSLNHYFALLASITDGDLAVGAGQTVLVAWLHGALLMHQWLLCTCAVFRAHRKSQKSLLNSNVAKKQKSIKHPELCCDCSPNKQPGRGRGREPRWVQDNGWPEQYITHLQIRFIRINNKEHHDHITLTCNQRFMHFYAINFTGMDFVFSSRFINLLQYIALVVNNWASELA